MITEVSGKRRRSRAAHEYGSCAAVPTLVRVTRADVGRGRVAAGAATVLALLAFVTTTHAPAADWGGCDLGDIRVDADFSGGRASACDRSSPDHLSVLILPESPGVNPSPWYAFRVTADAARRIELTLVYGEARHRYRPRLSRDGRVWENLPASRLRELHPGRVTLGLDVGPEPIWIAAQELWPAERHYAWLRRQSLRPGVTVAELGRSLQGRPIEALRTDPGERREQTLVITGRQHPPEVPGARALETFVEVLLDDSELSRRFRQVFRVVAVPLLNPDGVEAGHWRFGAGRKDLNRDWGPFSQPETILIRNLLAEIEADPSGRLAAFVDFHSTLRDVFYTQRDEDPLRPAGFYARWLGRLQERMPGYEVTRQPGHQVGLPTAKTWVYETYGVPAVSFEIGDETSPATADRLATEAAKALMETLLDASSSAPAARLGTGVGTFRFEGWAGPPLRVWYRVPETVHPTTPVLLVMHGMNRDADRYRDQWLTLAERHGFILVVPEFDAARFPGSTAYNLGNVVDGKGREESPERWSFAAVEPLFDHVRTLTGTRVDRYEMYGHSAGAQFVHRYLMFVPDARVGKAVVANAGWYTMPDRNARFPYGLAGSGVTPPALIAALARPMAVFVGTADNDRGHAGLRRTPEAMRQGPHRVARGEAFHLRGREAARLEGVAFGWTLRYVDGAAHDNAAMASAAAAWLYAP